MEHHHFIVGKSSPNESFFTLVNIRMTYLRKLYIECQLSRVWVESPFSVNCRSNIGWWERSHSTLMLLLSLEKAISSKLAKMAASLSFIYKTSDSMIILCIYYIKLYYINLYYITLYYMILYYIVLYYNIILYTCSVWPLGLNLKIVLSWWI